jgi:hypothetical protein
MQAQHRHATLHWRRKRTHTTRASENVTSPHLFKQLARLGIDRAPDHQSCTGDKGVTTFASCSRHAVPLQTEVTFAS